jgi:NAD(P)-dependent dehydrogenase (short-subunit alcohol dehydrogenase family)
MPTPVPQVTSLSLGKAGVRALAELLAAQFGPAGVHVATVTVAGAVAPGTAFDPDDIADEYWRLHDQPHGAWEREVLFEGRR